ncbi:F-box only protein 27-like isoform 1-T2 [Discoglossus pictus]
MGGASSQEEEPRIYNRNLLRNPCGQEGLHHWDFSNGGNGWAVEDNKVHLTGADSQKCFVTSYLWCQKSQVIDLLREGLSEFVLDHHQPRICISDWFAGRHDCGCEYEIHVQLLAQDRETIIREFTERPDPIPQWNDERYQQIQYVFQNYGRGVRFVRFTHKGTDTQFLRGFFGARITNSSVIIEYNSRDLSRSRPLVQFFMDLEPLPDELLEIVLSLLPSRELITQCRLVSKRWKRLVDSPTIWRIKCERESRTEVLRAASICPDIPWKKVCLKEPLSRNLLHNPCGAEGLHHWEFIHGGDGWVVENNRVPLEGARCQTSFVTSFFWCQKSQLIDLLKEGLWETFLDNCQPQICISDWFAGRKDCGCKYEIHVQLLAIDRETVLREYTTRPDPIPQWSDQRYHQVSYVFRRYGRGVRFVRFTHKGKDTQFWKGFYGARITNSSVTVKCDNAGDVPLPANQSFSLRDGE